jgi:DNA-directed RNA polymerase subunit omega
METLNSQKKVDSQITSRYTIVLAAAKRARQIIDGANPLTYAPTDRAVSIAVKELDEGKLIIKADPDRLENTQERPATGLYYQGISSVSKDDLREDFKDHYTADSHDDDDENYKEDDDYKEGFYKDDDDESYEENGGGAYKDADYKDDGYQDDDDDGFKAGGENYE